MSLRKSPEATQSRAAAQRSNAQASTGPRSEAGKNRSRWNALRHGRWASGLAWSPQSLRDLCEDPEEFDRLRQALHAAEGPSDDPLWVLQLEDLARLLWRRTRLEETWIPLVEHPSAKFGSDLAAVSPNGVRLLQQLDTADRAIDRKIRLLMRMREADERRERSGRGARDQQGPDFRLPGDFAEEEAAAANESVAEVETPARPEVPVLASASQAPAPSPGPAASKTSKLEEQSQNVIENKGSKVKLTSSRRFAAELDPALVT